MLADSGLSSLFATSALYSSSSTLSFGVRAGIRTVLSWCFMNCMPDSADTRAFMDRSSLAAIWLAVVTVL
jgi:hypothetical protein